MGAVNQFNGTVLDSYLLTMILISGPREVSQLREKLQKQIAQMPENLKYSLKIDLEENKNSEHYIQEKTKEILNKNFIH